MGTNIYQYSNDATVVRNAYDDQSRRIRKTVCAASAPGTPVSGTSFLYDGWNVLCEVATPAGGQPVATCYVWGLDLSGTLQGAGGVGGLLAVFAPSAEYPFCGETRYPCWDANGNVTDYLDADGNVAAHYGCDPFGNTIARSGPMAGDFAYRFSTKRFDAETGLYDYGYRFYSPELGRWMSRAPIEESGGHNLYNFVQNNPLNKTDYLGMSFLNCCDDCSGTKIQSTKIMLVPAAYRQNYAQTTEDGFNLLKALGANGNVGDAAELAMSVTSLSGILLSAAKIAVNKGMNAGSDAALMSGLNKLMSFVNKAYGEADGYIVVVKIMCHPCDQIRACWKWKSYKVYGPEKTYWHVQENENFDPASPVGGGFRIPDEQKALQDAWKTSLKEAINEIP